MSAALFPPSNLPMIRPELDNTTRATLFYLAVQRGRDRITLLCAPALEVVREPGKPPVVTPLREDRA